MCHKYQALNYKMKAGPGASPPLGRRLNEAAELYSELGFEVRLEPVDLYQEETMEAESCKNCFVTMQARTIYTRPSEKI